jgi:hypothetical protein
MNRVYRISEAQFEALLGKKKAYNDGYKANKNADGLKANPFQLGTTEYEDWKDGWLACETQKQIEHDEETLTREIGESDENVVNEVIAGGDVFKRELGRFDIDYEFYYPDLFNREILVDPKGRRISVNGVEYDVDIEINQARVFYGIDIEYREYGIKDIYLSPKSALLSGVVRFEGDDDSFDHDFELEYDVTGLKSNTLSGNVKVGNGSVQILDIDKGVKFDTEKSETDWTVYVVQLNVKLDASGANLTFVY